LSFMGKDWDHGVPGVHFWLEALRVAKPGAHLLAFGGTRTFHRLACAIEDAGWEIRDCVMWVYGSGFPKSLDVGKQLDKAAGAVREVVGKSNRCIGPSQSGDNGIGTFKETNWQVSNNITAPATDAAKQWDGWGTALKPAWEPILVCRKPLEGTVAANVLKWGVGGLNIDGCRVGTDENLNGGRHSPNANGDDGNAYMAGINKPSKEPYKQPTGRWPANLIHDGEQEVLDLFPETTSGTILPHYIARESPNNCMSGKNYERTGKTSIGDSGSAARFFYCAKASKRDRDEGCEGLEEKRGGSLNMRTDGHSQANGMDTGPRRNNHPTVKPTALMRYLCRLVTPPGGVVLDPFMGSGSTGKAAVLESFRFLGIEKDPEHYAIAVARLKNKS
ncbi:MAG: site-specific DNA-methyltransferase, partial [Verrucomicrobia bacterium]|nr:site-specific DNA-methyltransferase [Verrucomicrobiota bacterium]